MNRLFIIVIALASVAIGVSARQPRAGYRGFFEWSNDYRTEDVWSGYREKNFFTGISMSHGCQICPEFFFGVGMMWEAMEVIEDWMLAWYIHGRTDLKFGRFTPFGDIRFGYSVFEGGGIYFSPTIGYRFNWGRKVGINIGLGLTLRGYKGDKRIDIAVSEDKITSYYSAFHNMVKPYFSFRVGLDF